VGRRLAGNLNAAITAAEMPPIALAEIQPTDPVEAREEVIVIVTRWYILVIKIPSVKSRQ